MKLRTRTTTDIENEIIRTRGNLEAIHRSPFSEEDRVILEPKYKWDLKQLEDELKLFNIPVIEPQTVTG